VSLQREPEQIPAWGKPAGVTPAKLRNLMRNYYGMVKCIDDNVGRIIEKLRAEGILDRTIIVFTSDHGDLCGEHGRLNKGVPYEGSARIPFLMYCPGEIPAGTVVDSALSNVDFTPTVLNLMDVPLKHTVHGRDASALFRGDNPEWNDIAFIRSTGSRGQANAWLAAVTQQYKLVYSTNEVPWLIDLQADPNELTNRFSDPALQDQIVKMTQQLHEYAMQHDDRYAQMPGIRSWIQDTLN